MGAGWKKYSAQIDGFFRGFIGKLSLVSSPVASVSEEEKKPIGEWIAVHLQA